MRLADGHEHALTSYRSTDFFQQLYDYLKIDDDETLIGDSAYTGNVVNRMTSKEFLHSFSEQEIIAQPVEIRQTLRNFNRSKNSNRTTIEQVNRGVKRNALAGDRATMRQSLFLNEAGISDYVELAVQMEFVTMRMRKQVYCSNSHRLYMAQNMNEVNQARISLARTTFNNELLTPLPGAFYGEGSNTQFAPETNF